MNTAFVEIQNLCPILIRGVVKNLSEGVAEESARSILKTTNVFKISSP